MKDRPIRLPRPDLQVGFAAALDALRRDYLIEALSRTMA